MSRAIMIQGTGSSVGKSVLCAALCRIFRRHGLRVAPFKAQNMSNNAYVTRSGGEISRAQVVQAEAAGVEPTVDMNPVLLKPEGERGSQVVLHGRVWGRLQGTEFLTRKPLLWGAVQESLRRLQGEYELLVIEGAGSPAEINLRAGDIVNMRVAEAADAPVILVGDIDRGGVFASLIGTLQLLEPDERSRIAGFVINRFRGDPALLQPGLEVLEQRTGLPVLGVVPYLRDLGLPEEDAAVLDSADSARTGSAPTDLLIAALKLPWIANFDDLDPLRRAGARLRWATRSADLTGADLIVLPGSKSTAADLSWLKARGLADTIVDLANRGTPVLGLCGGFQILGQSVADPDGVESDQRLVEGLGLLPVRTVLWPEKTTRLASGRFLSAQGLFAGLDGWPISGYEIHAGATQGSVPPLLALERNGQSFDDGASDRGGWIVGTYLHGLLGSNGVAERLVDNLRARRAPLRSRLAAPPPDPLERLADAVEEALDMRRLYELIGLGPSTGR